MFVILVIEEGAHDTQFREIRRLSPPFRILS